MSAPAFYPPHPLTRWQTTWRNVVAVVSGGLMWLSVADDQWQSALVLFWLDLALGVLCLVAMQYRRRWPVAATAVTAAATALSASGIGAWAICQVSLSARRRWREIVPTALLAVLTGQVYNGVEPNQRWPWYTNLVVCSLAVGVVVAIGLYVGARRDLIASLRDRAERAEREQALQVASARASERLRIAREMHDVLAHRMSLVALHAGALAFRSDLGPDETRAAAETIRANAQRALGDLREILGLLRDPARGVAPADDRPQPTLGDLGSLLDDERAAGARISLRSEVYDLEAVPESIGRGAYRIIQEGLTNARKHAPDSTVTVELTGHPGDGLSLQVRNPAPAGSDNRAQGKGFGLIGLAERAAASQGRLEHGRGPEGDFVIRAWLPWQP